MKCVLLGCDFDSLGGCLMVTACYLVVTGGYCSLPGGYWWLLLVTGGYCLLLFVPNFSMNSFFLFLASNLCFSSSVTITAQKGCECFESI